MFNRAFFYLLMASLSASSGWAAQATGSQSREDLARLEQKADRVEARLHGKTGALERAQLQRQQRKIDDLIGRIEAGERVSPSEVDRAVETIPIRRTPRVGPNR